MSVACTGAGVAVAAVAPTGSGAALGGTGSLRRTMSYPSLAAKRFTNRLTSRPHPRAPAARRDSTGSEDRGLVVHAEDLAQRRDDLALRGACAHRVDDRRHGVVRPGGHLLERVEAGGDTAVVAALAQLTQPLRLRTFHVDVDHQDIGGGAVDDLGERVDADDDALARVQLRLVVESCLGNLALRVAVGDGADDAAALVDRLEVLLGGLFHAVGE